MSSARRRLLLLVPAALLAGTVFVAVSETGLRWALAWLVPTLTAEALSGRLIGPIEAHGLHWRDGRGDVRIGRLALDWSPARLLRGELRITQIEASDVAVAWQEAGATTSDAGLGVPLALRVEAARIERLTVRAAGRSEPLTVARIEAAGGLDARRLAIELLRVHDRDFEFGARGEFARRAGELDGDLRWSLHRAGRALLAGGGRVRGGADRMALSQSLVTPVRGRLEAELTALAAAPRGRLQLVIEETSLAPFDARLAGMHVQGEMRVEGTVERYALQLDVSLRGLPYAPARLQARGDGDGEALRLAAWHLELPAGALGGDARLDWSRPMRWQIAFAGRQLDPGRWWRDWPGRLAVNGEARGVLAPQPTLDLHLARVVGTLRGQELSAHADFGLQDAQHYVLRALELRVGDAQLQAEGSRRGRALNLRWQARADDLALLSPQLGGALETAGRLHGAWPQPDVDAQLRATRLRFGDYHAESVTARVDLSARAEHVSRATLDAAGVVLAGWPPLALRLDARGSPTHHRAQIETVLARERIELKLVGGLVAEGWRGTLAAGHLKSERFGNWQAETPVPLALGPAEARLERGCWRHGAGSLCLAGRWDAPRRFDARLEASAIDAGLLNDLLPADTALGGVIDGQARVRGGDGDAFRAEAGFRLGAGELRHAPAGASAAFIGHAGGQATLRVDAQRAHGQAALRLVDGGHTELEFDLPIAVFGIGAPHAGAVRGRLALELREIAPFGFLFPRLEQPRGELHADLTLDGSTHAPRVRGRLALERASAGVPALGITLREARLELSAADSETISITGEARSGEGRVRAVGRLEFGDVRTWTALLDVSGENVEAARLPEAQVLLSPALRLQARPRQIGIEGELHVPQARLRPRDLTLAVTPSPDVVRVDPTLEPPAPPWQITSSVRLVLGDKVQMDGFDFNGWITGNVLAEDRPARPATAVGELRVTAGHYKVYGKTLQVERGRLIFTGGPLDDPGLDMRAVRRVAGVVAGVQARGTLRRPQLTLVSEPAMSESDALSYLLVGRPAEQATRTDAETLYQAASMLGFVGGELLAKRIGTTFGIEDVRIEQGEQREQAALMLGTYLTPQLYVSYGVGLFETLNILQIRYRLGRRWLLQTETGAASGADVLYTIER